MKIFRIFAEFRLNLNFYFKKKKNFASKEECIVDIFSLFINVQKYYFLSIIFSFRIAHGIYIYILGERLMEISLRRIKPELENYRRRLLTTLTPSTPRLGTTAPQRIWCHRFRYSHRKQATINTILLCNLQDPRHDRIVDGILTLPCYPILYKHNYVVINFHSIILDSHSKVKQIRLSRAIIVVVIVKSRSEAS